MIWLSPHPSRSRAAMKTVACDVGNSSQVWLLPARTSLVVEWHTLQASMTSLRSLQASWPVSATTRDTLQLRSSLWMRRPCGAVPARRTPWRAPRWRRLSKAAPSASAGVVPSILSLMHMLRTAGAPDNEQLRTGRHLSCADTARWPRGLRRQNSAGAVVAAPPVCCVHLAARCPDKAVLCKVPFRRFS